MSVAPLAGAWIEICRLEIFGIRFDVAPLAGAWIEIIISAKNIIPSPVAPLAGAWIEIFRAFQTASVRNGRSPRGSVD